MAALAGLVTILAVLGRAIASDGYGTRPAPRSHRDVTDVDNHGLPTKYLERY
jgi:hypothetical protein